MPGQSRHQYWLIVIHGVNVITRESVHAVITHPEYPFPSRMKVHLRLVTMNPDYAHDILWNFTNIIELTHEQYQHFDLHDYIPGRSASTPDTSGVVATEEG